MFFFLESKQGIRCFHILTTTTTTTTTRKEFFRLNVEKINFYATKI